MRDSKIVPGRNCYLGGKKLFCRVLTNQELKEPALCRKCSHDSCGLDMVHTPPCLVDFEGSDYECIFERPRIGSFYDAYLNIRDERMTCTWIQYMIEADGLLKLGGTIGVNSTTKLTEKVMKAIAIAHVRNIDYYADSKLRVISVKTTI